MALQFISENSTPAYLALSSDIADSAIAGASLVGKLIFLTNTGAWKIIKSDLTLADYALPATFSGSIALGDVVVGESAAASDGIGAFGSVVSTPGDTVNSSPLMTIPLAFNGTTFDRLRGSVANGLLVSRAATQITPTAQASTASSVVLAGSIMDTLNRLTVAFVLTNTGAQSIDWVVYGGNASNLSDKVVVQASTTITAGAYGFYSTSAAPFRYYGVFIADTSPGSHGQGTLVGVSKG